ncbi:MAG: hypothetical protein R3B83_03910 [Nitrospirales bacterium]|nr:hypothetical protein [Nitrospirales bacterium]
MGDELFADGQPQPGSPLATCGGAVRCETVEELGANVLGNSLAGIVNVDVNGDMVSRLFLDPNFDNDFPSAVDFDGIPDKIHEDLAKAARVPGGRLARWQRPGRQSSKCFLPAASAVTPVILPGWCADQRGWSQIPVCRPQFLKVQDVIDDFEEGLRKTGRFQQIAVAMEVRWFPELAGHPNDSIHGSRNFMAHRG